MPSLAEYTAAMLSLPIFSIAWAMLACAFSGFQSLVSKDSAMVTLPFSSDIAPALNCLAFGSVGEPFIMTILSERLALSPMASSRERPWTSPTSSLSKEMYASIGPSASRS